MFLMVLMVEKMSPTAWSPNLRRATMGIARPSRRDGRPPLVNSDKHPAPLVPRDKACHRIRCIRCMQRVAVAMHCTLGPVKRCNVQGKLSSNPMVKRMRRQRKVGWANHYVFARCRPKPMVPSGNTCHRIRFKSNTPERCEQCSLCVAPLQ